MTDSTTQRANIIQYCKAHGSITVREAFGMGINSPTKRISEIRSDPRYVVTSEDIPVYGDDGKRVTHYSKYRIREVVS